jgi:hypothetical protein
MVNHGKVKRTKMRRKEKGPNMHSIRIDAFELKGCGSSNNVWRGLFRVILAHFFINLYIEIFVPAYRPREVESCRV